VHALSDLGVFEVAFGGGEPTEHPEFCSLIHKAYDVGIVPNFSTGTLAWLQNSYTVRAVRKCCGAFAYSPGEDEISIDALASIKAAGLLDKLVIQRVALPTYASFYFKDIEICNAFNIPYSLLGFKTAGRGRAFLKDYKAPCNPVWREALRSVKPHCLYVDTLFAARNKKLLEELGVSAVLYETCEGAFSAYIDATNWTIARDSYSKGRRIRLPMYSDGERCLDFVKRLAAAIRERPLPSNKALAKSESEWKAMRGNPDPSDVYDN